MYRLDTNLNSLAARASRGEPVASVELRRRTGHFAQVLLDLDRVRHHVAQRRRAIEAVSAARLFAASLVFGLPRWFVCHVSRRK